VAELAGALKTSQDEKKLVESALEQSKELEKVQKSHEEDLSVIENLQGKHERSMKIAEDLVDAKSALSANHTASRKAGFARAERE
jgi:hypothetical protein